MPVELDDELDRLSVARTTDLQSTIDLANGALGSANIFPDTTAGLAATTSGEYFSVPSAESSEYLILYKNNAGAALEVKRYPSAGELQTAVDDVDILQRRTNGLAFLLPGDVLNPRALLIVNEDGHEVQSLTEPSISSSSSDLLFGDLRDSAYGFGGDGASLPGAVTLPSQLITARRQEPPTALAYLSGTTPNREVRAVMRDGSDIRLSIPGSDPSNFVQNGDTVSYLRTIEAVAGSGPSIVDVIAYPQKFSSSITALKLVAGYGQSNSMGALRSVTPVSVSAIRPGRALMFSGGTRLTQEPSSSQIKFADIACLLDAFEQQSIRSNNPPGETPCSGVGFQLTETSGLTSGAAVLLSTHGVGGSGISGLVKGTRPYANLITSVMQAKVIAEIAGVAFDVPAIFWVQGEANVGTAYATYRSQLEQLQTDLDTDIKGITGQTNNVLLVGAQTSSWTASAVMRDDVPTVILDLALAYPDRFSCSGPMYPYPYVDPLHLSGQGQRNHGETIGRAIARKLSGTAQPMLYASSATRSGNVVTVTMAGAEGELVLDTSDVSNPGNYGIAFLQDSGSETISSISISGSSTVTITLSGVPAGANQRIEFGRSGVSGQPGGPTTGPRCCLRDTVSATRADGSAMHKYACHQTINIT